MAAALMSITGVGLISIVDGMMVWVALGMADLVRDGFVGVFTTVILETEGVAATYAGTATGLVMVFSGLGRLVAPPLGNSLADIASALPFVLWASLATMGSLGLHLVREGSSSGVMVAEAPPAISKAAKKKRSMDEKTPRAT